MRTLFIGCAILSAAATATAAEEIDNRWYVVPQVGYIRADVDQVVENDVIYGLTLGKQATENWNLDYTLSNHKLDPESGTNEFKQTGLNVDGLYYFNRERVFSMYGILGAGLHRTTFGAVKKTSPAVNLGLGAQTSFGMKDASVRFELRYRHDNNNGNIGGEWALEDWILTAGFVLPLGGKP